MPKLIILGDEPPGDMRWTPLGAVVVSMTSEWMMDEWQRQKDAAARHQEDRDAE